MRRTLFYFVPRDWVDDLVQETFVKAWSSFGKFSEIKSPRAWVYRIAINLAKDRFRTLKWKAWLGYADLNQVTEESVSPSQLNSSQIIREGLELLSDRKREVFVLFYFEGLKIEEIANFCEESLGTIKSRLHSGRKEFLEYLDSKGVHYG